MRLTRDQLISALYEYASSRLDITKECLVVTDGDLNIPAPLHKVCNEAARELANVDVDGYKFRTLVEGLKVHRCEGLYEHIMGQPIENAYTDI